MARPLRRRWENRISAKKEYAPIHLGKRVGAYKFLQSFLTRHILGRIGLGGHSFFHPGLNDFADQAAIPFNERELVR
jgi:hypothetical protein